MLIYKPHFTFILLDRLCQLSLFGASIKSIGATTCAFLVDQLTALNNATSNISNELNKNLGLDGKSLGLDGKSLGLNGNPSSVLDKLNPPKSESSKPKSLLRL